MAGVETATLVLEAALSTKPTETAVKIDLSAFLRSKAGLRMRRGRSSWLDRFEAGTLDFSLDNNDRRFDPNYEGVLANLIPNPSFEVNSAGWVVMGTGTSAERITTDGAQGSCCLEVTFNGADDYYGMYYVLAGLTPGATYTVSGYIKRAAGSQGAIQLDVYEFTVIDTDGITVATGEGTTGDDWERFTETFVYPLTGSGTVNIRAFANGTPEGSVLFDAIQLEQASSATAYTDGSLDNCRWSGTAHASTSYRGGPYYEDLLPLKRFWLSAVYGSTTYPQYAGYCNGWPPEWPDRGKDSLVRLSCVDGFGILGLIEISGSYPEEGSDERVERVLDAAGWNTGGAWVLDSTTNSQLDTTTVLAPSGEDRVILPGQTTIIAETLSSENALRHLQNVEKAENGLLFIDHDGAINFVGRHAASGPDKQVAAAIFGDGTGEIPYSGGAMAYDARHLYNKVTCTRKNGVAQTAEDATSQDNYYPRVLAGQSDLLATTDAEMADRANWLLARHKDPRWRINTLSVSPQAASDHWATLLGLELGDRVTVNRRPSVGDVISHDYNVEMIELAIVNERWEYKFGLSPVDPTLYWHISTGSDQYAPFAILGETTTLGY